MNFTEKLSSQIKNSPFYCRPLAFMSAAFLISLFLFKLGIFYFCVFLTFIFIYSLYLIITGIKKFNLKNPLPFLLIMSTLITPFISLPGILQQENLKNYYGKTVEVKVVIENTYYSESYGSMHVVKLKEIDGKRCHGNAILEIKEDLEFQPYDTLVIESEIIDTEKMLTLSEKLNRISNGIYIDMTSETVKTVTDENKSGFLYGMYKIKINMSDYLHSCLNPAAADFATALFVGDTGPLPMSFKRDMSAIGISHILAVSGMHTSMIAAMVGFLLNRTHSGRKTKAVITCFACIAFMFIAGLSPCVVRTVIMLIFSAIPCFFGRRADSITALMLSADILCLFSPNSVLSCSFLLSFFATLGIVLSASYISKRARNDLYKAINGEMRKLYKIFRPVVLSAIVSLSASAFTVPVLALYFGKVSFVAVISNFIAVPCSDYSMILLILIFIFGKIPIIGALPIFLFETVYDFLLSFSGFMAKNFETTVSLRYPFFFLIMMLFVSILLFLRLQGIRNPGSPIAAFLACTLIFVSCVQIYDVSVQDRGEVIYTANKNSDGLLVTSGNQNLYIDIGDGSKSLPAQGFHFIENRYYQTEIDAYMFTHYHSRHIGTIKYILSRNYIKQIYLPEPETESELSFYKSIFELVSGECKIIKFVRGETVKFGNADIETIPYTLLNRSTHPPLAVKIAFGTRAILYFGSSVMESDSAYFLLEMINSCKTIIIGRHGPKTKENIKIPIPGDANVYLSPFEDTAETEILSEANFNYLTADDNGFSSVVFKLCN